MIFLSRFGGDHQLWTEAQMICVWLWPLTLSEAESSIRTSPFPYLEMAKRFLCVSETSAALQPQETQHLRKRADPALQTDVNKTLMHRQPIRGTNTTKEIH